MSNRIRELRKAKNITMKQLGAALGLAESTISQYENCKRQPDNVTLVKLSKYFGVSVDYILGAEKSTPTVAGKRAASEDIQLSAAELELIRKYRRLDERGKSAVMNILNHEYAVFAGEEGTSLPRQA